MSSAHLFTAIILASVCGTPSGFTSAHPSVTELDPDSDLIEELKLDPIILEAMKPDDSDKPLRKLQKERCYSQVVFLAKMQTLMDIGKAVSVSEAIEAASLSKDLLELIDKPKDQLKCYEFRVEYLKRVEKFMPHAVAIGAHQSQSCNHATAARIDAEIELLKFKAEMAKPKK